MEELIKMINNSAILGIAVAVWIIVWAIKQTKLDNKFMPLVSLLVGVLVGLAYGFVHVADLGWFNGIFDGLLAGGFAVGGNEFVKQLINYIGGKSND